MTIKSSEADQLLTPAEVASLFRVDPKTVTRWAKAGKLSSIRTLGGHRRYRAGEVYALLEQTMPSGAAPIDGWTADSVRPAASPYPRDAI